VAFEVQYPTAISALLGDYVLGNSFLFGDGVPATVQISETAGVIEVGVSRTGTQNGGADPLAPEVPPGPGTHIVTLQFQRTTSAGSGLFTVQDGSVSQLTPPDVQPVPVAPPVPFSGGTFVIVN
jgi:hypothetical protein